MEESAAHVWDTWGQEVARNDFPEEVYFVFRTEMLCKSRGVR